MANDDLATYASILAIWMEGKCYIPLHPLQPVARCANIIEQVGIEVILDSGETTRHADRYVVHTGSLAATDEKQTPLQNFNPQAPAYILFTSGSTGTPKGVPISYGNVSAFLQSVDALGIRLRADDRCLQMFDLTFDLSVDSYLQPLLAGACVFTVRPGSIKWRNRSAFWMSTSSRQRSWCRRSSTTCAPIWTKSRRRNCAIRSSRVRR
nr:AMP-binding protein [Segatella baroniae]